MNNHKQFNFASPQLKKQSSAHGGDIPLAKKRKRPIGVRSTMHLVMRSSKAKGPWNFRKHRFEIKAIVKKFARKNYVHILSMANVGNHLHLHVRFRSRALYVSFIRALTASIMMAVTGFNRWNPSPNDFQFWDLRPFSRIVSSFKDFQNLKNYIQINVWEGMGYKRGAAKELVEFGILIRGSG